MMKKLFCAVLLALSAAVAVQAYDYTVNKELTVDNTAGGVGFTSTDIAAGNGHVQATQATCRNDSAGGEFRYTLDGTAPTTSHGVQWEPGDQFTISGTAYLLNFRAIRTGTTSGALSCTIVG